MHASLPNLPATMPAERSRSRRQRRSAPARRPVLHVVMPGLEVGREVPRKGETVTAFLRRTGWAHRDPQYGWQFRKGLPTVLEINGEPVLRKQWRRTKIAANDNIRFVSYPRGGQGSTGKQVIGLVALVAVAAFTAGIGAAGIPALGIAGGSLGAYAAAATLGLGGSLLVNALTAPKPGGTNAPNATQDQIYSIQAQGNVAKLGQPLPVWYGRLKNYPDLAATPWSEFVGNDQYLNVLLSVSMGSMEYEQLLISDTPFWDPINGVASAFSSATIGFHEPGDPITEFPTNVSQSDEVNGQQLPSGTGISFYKEPITPGDWIGPFVASPAGERCYRIAIDYAFPAGCYIIGGDSKTLPANSVLTVQYQAVNDAGAPIGDWQTGYSSLRQFASRGPTRDSIVFDVAPGRYRVRFRRDDGVPSTSGTTSDGNFVGATDVIWAGLRGFLQGDNTFPDVSTIAIRIKATETTQGSFKFGVIGTRKLPVWHRDTAQFVLEATRSPTWAGLDIAANSQYGAEIQSSKTDFNTFVNHAAGCAARGDTFDYVFSTAVAVPEAIDKALNVARSRHFWLGDTISIVRDEWTDVPSMLLTDREIVRDSTQVEFKPLTPEDPDAVTMEYVDEATWTLQQVQYPPNTELFTAVKPSPKRLDGIVKRENAFKEAAFYYRCSIYRRENVQIGCEYEGRAITQGQTLRVSSELPENYGQNGAIIAANSNVLTLSRDVSWEDAGPYFMRLRRANGKSFGPITVTRGDNDNEVILDAGDLATVESQQGITLANVLLRADGGEDPSFELGTAENQSRVVKVLTGQPNGDTFTLAMVVDDKRVHETDLGSPPILPVGQFPSNQTLSLIFGLNATFDQGTAEPMLRASWFPAPGAFFYIADVSYDGGNSWIQVYEGQDNKFEKVVTLSALTLRVQAIGQLPGPYKTESLEAPTIQIADNTVAYQSLQDAIKEKIAAMDAQAADDRARTAKLAKAVAQALARTNINKNIIRTDLVSSSDRANASISRVETVATDAEAAVAELQSTIGVQFDDVVATVDELSTAIATIEGYAAAQWTVGVTVDSAGRKSVASIMLMADSDNQSAFGINANNFFVTFPDAAGGDPVPVFAIGNVNGVPRTVLLGDIYVDGGVITRMVGAGQITGVTISAQTINTMNLSINSVGFDQIIANAVTKVDYSDHGQLGFSGGTIGLISRVVEIKSGSASVFYNSQFNFNGTDSVSFSQNAYIDFYVDGALERTWSWIVPAAIIGGGYSAVNTSVVSIGTFKKSLSPGNHTFALNLRGTGAFHGSSLIAPGTLEISDFRR